MGSANFRRHAMLGRMDTAEALRIGMIDAIDDDLDASQVISEIMTTESCAVTAAKELSLGFDRWNGDDESLREWTLDFTSRMRGSPEGQEGLSSFLESATLIGSQRSDIMLKRTLVANRGGCMPYLALARRHKLSQWRFCRQ